MKLSKFCDETLVKFNLKSATKDDLIEAYLQASDDNLRAWFATLLQSGDDPPEERLLAVAAAWERISPARGLRPASP